MRTYDEYRQILELWSELKNKKAIARITGIPRPTVRDCIRRFGDIDGLDAYMESRQYDEVSAVQTVLQTAGRRQAYAYALGMYLGDGYINLTQNGRSYRLRIILDKKYPNIIDQCKNAIATIRPANRVGMFERDGCVEVGSFSKHWPKLIPQDSDGPKHERRIILEEWQQRIVDEFPLEFFRGLYHSDGSRSRNIVTGKNYPRYIFSNASQDIIKLFTETCDQLELHWTLRQPSIDNNTLVLISRRDDVARLDRLVGPKS